jgi:hypothetical protein
VDLLPFDETRRRLRLVGKTYVGVREIPIERIIGSVDRDGDFDRGFTPRHRPTRRRMAGLREVFADGAMPPISVFEVGGAYFVEDGHHRVALAREQGAEFIDAEVTRLETTYEVPPGADPRQLVHTEQQRILLEETGLGRARPHAVIEFTLLEGYAQLCDIIKAHGYDMSLTRGVVPAPEDVAGDWYDSVYVPAAEAAREAHLPERMLRRYESLGGLTEADLVLALYQVRRDLRAYDPNADFDAAADELLHAKLTRQNRRQVLDAASRPLAQRSD